MKTDFEMIVHRFPENNDLTVVPISDVHFGTMGHMQKEWKAFCENVLKSPHTYVTLGGDLINNATRSSVSNIFEETMRPSQQKRLMAEMLKPLAENNRILCAVGGNHEKRSGKDVDDDPMLDIMCKLDLEDLYRENMAFVKLDIGKQRTNGQKNPTYVLAVTHGAGGGLFTGTAVTKNERFGYAIDGIDALIVGHTHKGALSKPAKLRVDPRHNIVTLKPFVVAISVPWLNYGGYALRQMMLPATSGDPQIIKLAGKEKKVKLEW